MFLLLMDVIESDMGLADAKSRDNLQVRSMLSQNYLL